MLLSDARIILTSFGSAGDFNPVLAVASQLHHMGANVTFVANPFYAPRIEAAGVRFVAAGRYFDVFQALEAEPRYFHPTRGGPLIWKELVLPSIREIFPVINQEIHQTHPHIVVSHCLSFAGSWAAQQKRVPLVTLTPTPFAWLSRQSPGALADWVAPHLLWPVVAGALQVGLKWVLGSGLKQLAHELGVPADDDVLNASSKSAALNLGLWSSAFRGGTSDDPPRSEICGFPFPKTAASMSIDPKLMHFLDDGPPPIVAGFGSAAILHADELFGQIAVACESLGQRCLLIGPRGDKIFQSQNRHIVASAPYDLVFSRAAAIVHHGGLGTCAEAIRAGKASVITPFAFDQFDTAFRAERAGIAVRLPRRQWNEKFLCRALSLALDDPSLHTAVSQLSEKIKAEKDGAQLAAERILQYISSSIDLTK